MWTKQIFALGSVVNVALPSSSIDFLSGIEWHENQMAFKANDDACKSKVYIKSPEDFRSSHELPIKPSDLFKHFTFLCIRQKPKRRQSTSDRIVHFHVGQRVDSSSDDYTV